MLTKRLCILLIQEAIGVKHDVLLKTKLDPVLVEIYTDTYERAEEDNVLASEGAATTSDSSDAILIIHTITGDVLYTWPGIDILDQFLNKFNLNG